MNYPIEQFERLERDIGYQIDHDKMPSGFAKLIIEDFMEVLQDRFQDNIETYLHAVLVSGTKESREVIQDIFQDISMEGDFDKLQEIDNFYRRY